MQGASLKPHVIRKDHAFNQRIALIFHIMVQKTCPIPKFPKYSFHQIVGVVMYYTSRAQVPWSVVHYYSFCSVGFDYCGVARSTTTTTQETQSICVRRNKIYLYFLFFLLIIPPIFLVIFHFEILILFCVSENYVRVRLDFLSFFLLPSRGMSPDSDSDS